MAGRSVLFGVKLLVAVLLLLVSTHLGQASNDTPQATGADMGASSAGAIPAEMEQLFPPDAVFDKDRWEKYQHPSTPLSAGTHKDKVNWKLEYSLIPDSPNVCDALLANLSLYGGQYRNGTFVSPPHPRHPDRDWFGPIRWESLIPSEHIRTIRNIYYAMLKGTTLGKNRGEGYLWKKMAPIIKRFLEKKRGILLQRSGVDLDWDGQSETVYRMALTPFSDSVGPDGIKSHRWQHYAAGSSSKTDAINIVISGNSSLEMMRYDGKPYIISGYSLNRLIYNKDEGKASLRVLGKFSQATTPGT